ncbi:neuroligin-4, X-linked isoform X2 [Homalodisca vitripennis]|uniref:neuroligin-4, X-linked isoform X2 n=1 Tax=Homalodisca vitripennis TaxID=197043 RepID=UPI001EEA94F2|nr:neuroligin-4, X-linked isoform X2 [Homalodisca vitripennis]
MFRLYLLLIPTAYLWETFLCYEYGPYPSARIVDTKQGQLKGTIRTLRNLDPVEVYLGIPYAAAPVGSQRFMPPASPPPWSGVRIADSFGPVCPQSFPPKPATTIPTGRWGYMDRVRHFLSNQSEDCLYLNVYAPVRDHGHNLWEKPPPSNLPVMVFIHGESFEWNSGNLYDGSVLASYGKVIVVTVNFRLGILGFLKPGVSAHVPSNFGLLDQVAALEWVKSNIIQFGGDPRSVTLMGHGTGAACVSHLMISPLSQAEGNRGGLFHRAILMSGTALADWALTSNPVQVTIQVAQALNCPDSEDRMADCLRRKRLHELTSVDVQVPPFKTPFGPVVDGHVVPNEPSVIMKHYTSMLQQFDMMSGLTEMESYNLLSDVALVVGLTENEFIEKLNEFFNAKYELPELARTKAMAYYRTWEKTRSGSPAQGYRDTLLQILSDARVAAPVVRTAQYHCNVNPKSYFYVFQHGTNYANLRTWIQQSVQGEELPYVFGVPLETRGLHYDTSYNQQEKLLSEVVMTLWTNFAKTGNPNAPRRHNFQTQSHSDWRQYDVEWPEFEQIDEKYYSIGIPPSIQKLYRQRQMNFWNHDLPLSLNRSDIYINPPHFSPEPDIRDKDIITSQQGTDGKSPPPPRIHYDPITFMPPVEPEMSVPEETKEHPDPDGQSTRLNAIASSVTLSIVILVGISFLVVNLCAFAGLYYQRDKLRVRERIVNTRYRCVNVGTEDDDMEDHYMKTESRPVAAGTTRDTKNAEIKSILKSSEGIYEQVKSGSVKTASVGKAGKRMGISRQASSSTVTIDPHTKVKEWIAQEIVQRCSPRILRKGKKTDLKVGSCDTCADQLDQISNKTLDSNTSKVGSLSMLPKPKAKKVSVAIDATPATRSASVLQQTPIELTKSMDEGLALTYLSPSPYSDSLKASTSMVTILKRPSLQRSDAMNSDESISERVEPLRRSTSINLQVSAKSDNTPIVAHFHSRSDPVPYRSGSSNPINVHISPDKGPCDVLYSQVQKRPKVATPAQLTPTRDKHFDINVTSRDDLPEGTEVSAEEALDNIKRRNYPKVLPDYPDEEDFHLQKATKRRSLPLSSHFITDPGGIEEGSYRGDIPLSLKVPPPPPPRVSTLGRKHSNTSPVTPISTSQLTVNLKPTVKSNVPVAVRNPVTSSNTPIRPATHIVDNVPPHSQIKRIEPRVIIKPTMNPITSKKDKQSNVSNIPRVTPQQPSTFGSSKDLSARPPPSTSSKLPEMGMGRKAKITPIKKTVSTETALDSCENTAGTIKRLNK